tara:strand:- start:6 stop:128 length:123 start_codon:yes stop_codon:yes gene_type:complete
MNPNEFKVFAVFILILLCILIITASFLGCDSGWSVGGLDI